MCSNFDSNGDKIYHGFVCEEDYQRVDYLLHKEDRTPEEFQEYLSLINAAYERETALRAADAAAELKENLSQLKWK